MKDKKNKKMSIKLDVNIVWVCVWWCGKQPNITVSQ